jgi:hypothetical protein
MPSKYWVKVYHEVLDDVKVAQLDDHLWRRFFECVLLAGDFNQKGMLPTLSEIAFRLRTHDEEQLETDLLELQRKGFLESKDGSFIVRNFEKRQAPLPKAEYMRKKREKRRKDQYYGNVTDDVTSSNADIDTDIDKDTDTDEDIEALQNSDFSDLLDAFVSATGIQFGGNPQVWVDNLGKMKKAGVTAADITAAVEALYAGDYTIVSPKSIYNTAISEMSKRTVKAKVSRNKNNIPVKEY